MTYHYQPGQCAHYRIEHALGPLESLKVVIAHTKFRVCEYSVVPKFFRHKFTMEKKLKSYGFDDINCTRMAVIAQGALLTMLLRVAVWRVISVG